MNLVRLPKDPLFSSLVNQMWNDMEVEKKERPATNIIENEKEFKIMVSLPGWTKDEVKLEIDQDLLKISGEKEDANEGYLRKEFKTTSFERSFSLPEDVLFDKIVAEHKNGILEISIPKNIEEKEKLKRLIQIQ